MTDIARKVFDIEIESLQHVATTINGSFTETVNALLGVTGKVIVAGMGKSGIIGKKIAATLASTGTPSFFLHPGEAFHGDLGMIENKDAIILISYSGETDEILKIIPFLKWNGNVIVSISGNKDSTLAKNSHHHIEIVIKREACPHELAPTSSTTATLVMGDALAMALMEARQFKAADFARFHPGGNLGRKLLIKVKDLMRRDQLPFVSLDTAFTALLLKMSEGRLGMTIVGDKDHVKGVVTDGDIRRALLKNPDTSTQSVENIMTPSPVIISEETLVEEAEQLMFQKKITTILIGSAEDHTVSGIYQIYNR